MTENAPEEVQVVLDATPMAAPTVAEARNTEVAGLMAQPPEGQGLDQRS